MPIDRVTWCFIFLFKICLVHATTNICKNCPESRPINITTGSSYNNKIVHNYLVYEAEDYWTTPDGTIFGCHCDILLIPKCCKTSEIFVDEGCETVKDALNFTVPEKYFSDINYKPSNVVPKHKIIHNRYVEVNCSEWFPLDLQDGADSFYFRNNTFFSSVKDDLALDRDEFCFDYYQDDCDDEENRRFTILVCIDGLANASMENKTEPMMSLGMILSMPFLLATFIVYALLPDRNLHMKALMSYVITLFFSYLLLVINQLGSTMDTNACIVYGYFNLFFFMASFFWMNVICIDIWFTFGGIRSRINRKEAEKRRFKYYCVYAWGMSLLHFAIVATIDGVARSGIYSPNIGEGQCFLAKGYAELFYFYGPMGVIIAVNITLFATTALKIYSIKKDTAVLRKGENTTHSQDNHDKQTFKLYIKLLFAMGINWTMEITSWAVNLSYKAGEVPKEVWYLTDFCNAMYGVFIFFLFVFKKSVWKMVKRRYYALRGRSYMAHSMSQNQTRTNYSTSVTAVSTEC